MTEGNDDELDVVRVKQPVHVRRRGYFHWARRMRPPHWQRWLLGVAVLAVLAGVVWIVVTASMARREVSSAEADVNQLKSAVSNGDFVGAAKAADSYRSHAARAHSLTTGPAWWAAAELPWIGRPVVTARGCAAQADQLGSQVLAPLIQIATRLDLTHLVHGGTLDIGAVTTAGPVVISATQRLDTSIGVIDHLPTTTWLHSADTARGSFLTSLQRLKSQLHGADSAVLLLPDMLGSKGTKRYFVGLENEAESRGIGGLPGAFAIVTATNGKLSFGQFENDTTLDHVHPTLDLGAEFNARYKTANPTQTYANSDISPDFRDAATIWAAMWKQYSGQQIDGAIAIDPTALGYLLKVTGPARLADGSEVNGSNVASLTEQGLYAKLPDVEQRKAYVLQIASAIAGRIESASGSTALLHAVSKAADERRLLVWSSDPAVEANLQRTSLSGTLQAGNRPFAGFTVVNATGGKLDYYLERSMTYDRAGCGAQNKTTATFTLVNAVPPGPLPAYTTVRNDKPNYPTAPGDNKLLVSYYATGGSVIGSVTVDGKKTIVSPGPEKGLVVFTVPVELARGSTHTVSVTLYEPPRTGSVQVLQQPLVKPMKVSTTEPNCS